MSDRKYRQQGYQSGTSGGGSSSGGSRGGGIFDDRPQHLEGAPKGRGAERNRADVFRCKSCGERADPDFPSSATCKKCGAALHACVQCRHFDTVAPYQCRKPIPAPIPAKSRQNDCTLFEPTIALDLKGPGSSGGGSGTSAPDRARSAFDSLFGKKS